MLRSPLWLAIPLALFGFAEFGWGVLTFVRPRPLVPRVAIVVALVPVLAWIVGLALAGAVPGGAATLLPLGVASAFELFVAAGLGRTLRSEPRPRSGTAVYMLGVGAGLLVTVALLVVALTAAQSPDATGPVIEVPTHHVP